MPNEILTRAIDELCDGTNLTADHTSAALAEIMEGRVEPVQIGAFLIALRAKGETDAELVGLARTMRALAAHVEVGDKTLVDTAGTGGGPSTFNVSTTAALIAAGAGCFVAKHGNRSATSRSGSADLLEALGVQIELSPEQVADCINEVGFGLKTASLDEIGGGEPDENAAVAREIFDGGSGPARDIAVLNAGATIFVAGQAGDLAEGVEKAGEALASGAVGDVLEKLVARSRELAGAAS